MTFRYCDGVTRRSFMRLGALGVGGLCLPELLRADEAAGRSGHKAVIMVYLSGGISHQDTFDLKPEAPPEIRGEFLPIATSVPGMEISEKLPRLAQVAHRYTLIRSVVGQRDEHSSFQNLVGRTMGETQREGYPNFGSVISKVQGPTSPTVPPFVDLFPTMQHRPYNSTGAGYLGSKYHQVRADGEDLASMKLRFVEPTQLDKRRELLHSLNDFRRAADRGILADVDESYRKAFEVLTSSAVVDALDVTKEDPKVREKYSGGSSKHLGDGAPLWNDQLLQALRLVQAGVRVVTVAYGFWDTHGKNFRHLNTHLPAFDAGIAALIEGIYEHGLDREVTLVVWGEFGRTPKINKDAGRDHWAAVQSALIAGGGMPQGQVIGSTDKTAAYALDRPVDYRDVLATIYAVMDINPHDYVRDARERPVLIMPESAKPIRELIG
jgi:hypothetical protein